MFVMYHSLRFAVSDIDEEYEVGNLFARRAMQGYQGEPEVSTVIILYIIKAERSSQHFKIGVTHKL